LMPMLPASPATVKDPLSMRRSTRELAAVFVLMSKLPVIFTVPPLI